MLTILSTDQEARWHQTSSAHSSAEWISYVSDNYIAETMACLLRSRCLCFLLFLNRLSYVTNTSPMCRFLSIHTKQRQKPWIAVKRLNKLVVLIRITIGTPSGAQPKAAANTYIFQVKFSLSITFISPASCVTNL